jgi:Uncharacterised protein family (UPF0172)
MVKVGLGMVRPSLLRLLLSVISNPIVRPQATNYAHSRQLQIVGFHEALERVGDMRLSGVGEWVVAKIQMTNFPTPVALVVSLRKLWVSASFLSTSDVSHSSMDPS